VVGRWLLLLMALKQSVRRQLDQVAVMPLINPVPSHWGVLEGIHGASRYKLVQCQTVGNPIYTAT
jgi:hypothetical protein